LVTAGLGLGAVWALSLMIPVVAHPSVAAVLFPAATLLFLCRMLTMALSSMGVDAAGGLVAENGSAAGLSAAGDRLPVSGFLDGSSGVLSALGVAVLGGAVGGSAGAVLVICAAVLCLLPVALRVGHAWR